MHSPSSTAGPRASLRATALAALAVSTSLLLHALPVQAAEPAASAAARSYQIQPGPLGPALMAFAAQAGVNLGMDLQQLVGMETRGLSGTFSVEDGFAQLLNTSGWTARRVGAGNYALEKLPAAARQAPSAAAAVPSPSPSAPAAAQATELAAITVTARTQNNLVAPSRQVTILEGQEVEQLRQGSDSLATMLSKVVPGMADSSHTITDYGQTLRGRNMLVLVDGVPLNTNRDSSRNLANINPADIEQIEVLRGSSAIYGSGAAGGIVSIRTKRPSGETRAETIVTGSAPLSRLRGAGWAARCSTTCPAAARWSTIR